MEQDGTLCCSICSKIGGELLSRCNHRFHLRCLDTKFFYFLNDEQCPHCEGRMSRNQLLEDIIAKRPTSKPLFHGKSSKLCEEKVVVWGIEYKNEAVLSELLKNRVDLVIPATELKQLDFLKGFMERELAHTDKNTQLKYLPGRFYIFEQLRIVNYMLKNEIPNIWDTILQAARDASFDIVQYFVERNAEQSCFPLAAGAAAYNGHLEIVKYLTKKRVHDRYLVIRAIEGGHLEIMKYLIKLENLTDFNLFMEQAAVNGQIVIFKYFIKKGFTCPYGIMKAATFGQIEMVKYLTETGYYYSDDALEAAAVEGHLEVLKYLIEQGNYRTTIVDKAASKGHAEVVKYLVKIGKGYSSAAFKSGYQQGNVEIVRCLLEDGHPCSSDALDFAAEHGHLELVKYLVGTGKPCTSNAIDRAAWSGHTDVIRCLVEDGRSCTSNAFFNAAGSRKLEILEFLIENRNDCSAEAVSIAAESGYFDIIKRLIEAGAPCTEKAIGKAAAGKHEEIVNYLQENMKVGDCLKK